MSRRSNQRAEMPIAALWLLVGCGSRSGLSAESTWVEQSVKLELGTVAVGDSAVRTLQIAVDAHAARRFERSFAPGRVSAPRTFEVMAGQRGTLEVVWTPDAPGTLDAAILYGVRRDAVGRAEPPVAFRVELSGTAIAARAPECVNCKLDAGVVVGSERDAGKPGECPRGPSGVVCDDANPCTADRCQASGCKHEPALEGEDCGSFDCKVGHVCATGTCVQIDLSRHSDGMACDGGDPCLADGECRGGLCYASTEPRLPRVLDRLPTYGENASDAATDGELVVFADPGQLDIAQLQGGALAYRSTLVLTPPAAYVEALGERQFLVRSVEGTVAKLDATDPLLPAVTQLPHIVPKPVKLPDGATLTENTFQEKWTVVNGVVLLATSTSWDTGADASTGTEQTFRLTAAPLDPALGAPRMLDIHAYRMAVIGDTVTWTLPGYGTDGTQAVGIFQIDPAGKTRFRHSLSADEVNDMGCGFPHDIGAAGQRFVTLSVEDDVGYYRICLWQVADDPADGFELLKARGLDEHVHSCGIELDENNIYLSCGTRNARGWLGELLEMGETVRYSIDDFVNGSKSLKTKDGELLARVGGGVKTEIEAGYLWTIGDMATALDIYHGNQPLSGVGFGNLNAAVADGAGERALGGGLGSFGVIEAVAGQTPAIRFGDWRFYYPHNGRLQTDMRVLRHDADFASANPIMAYYPDTSTEALTATLGAGGAIELDVRQRSTVENTSSWRPIAVTADRTWLFEGGLSGWAPDDAEAPTQQIATGNVAIGELRTDASRKLLVGGDGTNFVVVDPTIDPAAVSAPIGLSISNQFAQPYPYRSWDTQLIAVDGDLVLAGTSIGVELHSRGFHFAPVKLELGSVDTNFPVALPLAEHGNAIATYMAQDGTAWLVQLAYADGVLREVARLQTDRRVASVIAFGTRWLFATEGGVELADLACWPDPDEAN